MIKANCSKQDCFFRSGDKCCNLCATGEDPCGLYWPAEHEKEADDEAPSPLAETVAAS